MRKTVLFIAMSLDGCIADARGGTGWLEGQVPGADDMVSYEEFIQEVDTVIMGANTFRQLVTELSPGEWVYPHLTSYIITHSPGELKSKIPENPGGDIYFTEENPCRLVKRLQAEEGKNIWICGGAEVAGQLMKEDLIDQYYINVIPAILGGGIHLFNALEKEIRLKLIHTRSYNGITDLVYERR